MCRMISVGLSRCQELYVGGADIPLASATVWDEMCALILLCGQQQWYNKQLCDDVIMTVDNDDNVYDSVYIYIHTVFRKNTHSYFYYNSGVSLSIYIVFIPVEREMNTLQ